MLTNSQYIDRLDSTVQITLQYDGLKMIEGKNEAYAEIPASILIKDAKDNTKPYEMKIFVFYDGFEIGDFIYTEPTKEIPRRADYEIFPTREELTALCKDLVKNIKKYVKNKNK